MGSAALELYADGALLRSVAVAPQWQGRGLGHALTDAAIRLARDRHVPAIYLLTTTAERFSPAIRNGERVSVIAEIEIPFKLSTVDERELLRRASEKNRQIRCMNHPDLWARQCRK